MTSKPVELGHAVRASPVEAAAIAAPAMLRPLGRGAEMGRLLRAYLTLTKPGIIWLLLVTTVPAMVMAGDGWPSIDLVLLTLVGGMLTAGGANAINQWFDRDIDTIMRRTRQRPLPQGQIAPASALLFGVALAAVGGVQLGLTVNPLSAALAEAAVLFYVFVYTIWLKRWTPQNIVIGGAAGAVPPLVGWTAVRGSLDLAPALLFLIVFLWTPPHFWALALRYKDDYARAGVPMLPVVRGEEATKRQIVWYSVALALGTLPLFFVGGAGWLYLGAALVLGAAFIAQAVRVWRGSIAPMALFFFSIVYLPLLFLAAGADALLF